MVSDWPQIFEYISQSWFATPTRRGVYLGLEMKLVVKASRGSNVSSSLLDNAVIRPLLRPSSSSTATIWVAVENLLFQN